ncbi:MAG: carbon-nitrogen hydrolase family protein [Alphaproteobacteria bacterium]
MKIGIYQCAAGGFAPNKRIADLEKAVEGQEVDLIVCPELFLTGYNVGSDLLMLAEPITGPKNAKMSALARATETAFVYGFVESDKGSVYNSVACVNAQGKIVSKHRKLMLPPGFERDYFKAGKELTTFELDGVKIGLLICYDLEFPEAARATVKAGADVLIVATALGAAWPVVAEKMVPTRAFENGVWVVYANHAGKEGDVAYLGRSCIVDPNGQDVARAGDGAEIISAELNLSKVTAAQEKLPYGADAKILSETLTTASTQGGRF